MLTHPTHEALSALKLDGMAEAFAELIAEDRGRSLDPVAWIGLMLDREQARRGTRRFQSRLRAANLRHGDACMEDVDYRTSRGLDRALAINARTMTSVKSILLNRLDGRRPIQPPEAPPITHANIRGPKFFH